MITQSITNRIRDVDGDSYYIDFETVKEIDGYVVWWEMKDY